MQSRPLSVRIFIYFKSTIWIYSLKNLIPNLLQLHQLGLSQRMRDSPRFRLLRLHNRIRALPLGKRIRTEFSISPPRSRLGPIAGPILRQKVQKLYHISTTPLHSQERKLTAPCNTATTCDSSLSFSQHLARLARSFNVAESVPHSPFFEFHPSTQRAKLIPRNISSASRTSRSVPVSHGIPEHSWSSGRTSIPSCAACVGNPNSVVCSVRRSGDETRRVISGD